MVEVIPEVGQEWIVDLVEIFATTWWAGDRDHAAAAAAIAGADLAVGLVDRDADRLVGVTRVLTDGAFVALILDVVVHPEWRGRGLGALLMEAVLARPELAAVRSIELVCQPDLVPFYRRFGFTDQVGASRLMRRTADPRLAT